MILRKWADGEYPFRLAIGQLRSLQDKTGVGPMALVRRLLDGSWMVDDVRETIRFGLIGGGMKPVDAGKMIETWVDPFPLAESAVLAQEIAVHAVVGVPDDPVGKSIAGEAATEASASPFPH